MLYAEWRCDWLVFNCGPPIRPSNWFNCEKAVPKEWNGVEEWSGIYTRATFNHTFIYSTPGMSCSFSSGPDQWNCSFCLCKEVWPFPQLSLHTIIQYDTIFFKWIKVVFLYGLAPSQSTFSNSVSILTNLECIRLVHVMHNNPMTTGHVFKIT